MQSPNLSSSRKLQRKSQQQPAPVAPPPASKPMQRMHSAQSSTTTKKAKTGLFKRLSSQTPTASPTASPAVGTLSGGVFTANAQSPPATPKLQSTPRQSSPFVAHSSKLFPQVEPVSMAVSATPRTVRKPNVIQTTPAEWDNLRSQGFVLKGNVFAGPIPAEEDSPFLLSPAKFETPSRFASARPTAYRESVASDCTFPQSCYAESIADDETAMAPTDSCDGSVICFSEESSMRPFSTYTTATRGSIPLDGLESTPVPTSTATWWETMTGQQRHPYGAFDATSPDTSIDSHVDLARRRLRASSIATDFPDFASSCDSIPEIVQFRPVFVEPVLPVRSIEARRLVLSDNSPRSLTPPLSRGLSYTPALDLIIGSYAESMHSSEENEGFGGSSDEDRVPSLSRSSTVMSLVSLHAPSTPKLTSTPPLAYDASRKIRPSRIPQPTLMFSVRTSSRNSSSNSEGSLSTPNTVQSMIFNIDRALEEVSPTSDTPTSRFSANSSSLSVASSLIAPSVHPNEKGESTSLASSVSASRLPVAIPKPVSAAPPAKTRAAPKSPKKSGAIASWFGFKSGKQAH